MQTGSDRDSEEAFLVSLRRTFIEEAAEFLESCEESLMALDDPAHRNDTLADIFRAYHSVKGSASAIGCEDLASFAHKAEDCLAAYRKAPERVTAEALSVLLKANDAIRARLPTILAKPQRDEDWRTAELVTELKRLLHEAEGGTPGSDIGSILVESGFAAKGDVVDAALKQIELREKKIGQILVEDGAISHEQLEQALDQQKQRGMVKPTGLAIKIDATRVDAVLDMVGELVVIKSQITAGLMSTKLDPRLRTLIGQLDKSVRELHERTLAMRMISLRSTFLKLQRSVKDVSTKLGKPVEFEVAGEDTEIDRAMVERIADPLMHLCRNAVDHGIEPVELRRQSRKVAAGHISLKAFRKGETVTIEIRDDGRGIDKRAVVRKAIERGMLPSGSEADKVADREAFDLLFQPGFSTAEKVTDVSGRGVGLDVVRSNITALNGTVDVESTAGQGSLFRLCLPLTTAITDGIVVTVANKPFILPLDSVLGFFELRSAALVAVDERTSLVKIKEVHYPFLRLGDFVGVEQSATGLIVLLDALGTQIALQVDHVLGKTQVVLKSIGSAVGSTEGLGGAAVMGDGRVALIIDVGGLAAISERTRAAAAAPSRVGA